MKTLKNLFVILSIFVSFTGTSFASLKPLNETDTRSMKITIERIITTQATINKIVTGLTSIVKGGMQDEDFQFPEDNVRRVKESISLVKQDIKNLQALMKGKTFDTWEKDQVTINSVSRKLSKSRSKIKYMRKIHNLSHGIDE